MDVRFEGGTHGETGHNEPDLILADDQALIAASNTGDNEPIAYMGILTMADGNLVARYCQTWARWRAADEFIAAKGKGYPVHKNGKIISIHRYPHTVAASQLLSELTRMEDRLGLSPPALASPAVESKEKLENEPEEKARFFRQAER